ncbi:MAG: hypothetical protein ABSC42_13910 [Tepidisphaeraceae bacterium]|jgi:hypothetical protein
MTKTKASAKVLGEPTLEFRHGQRLTRPNDGLSLFGPYDADLGSRPGAVTYSVVGSPEGIEAFHKFARQLSGPTQGPEGKSAALWPEFPGFDVAFGVEWPAAPAWQAAVDRTKLLNAANLQDKYQRVHDVVNLMLEPIETAQKRDEQPRVIVCVVPDDVWKTCRPQQRVPFGLGEAVSARELKERIRGNQSLFTTFDPIVYKLAPDFRRQLKARVMEHGAPVQIIRESTLALDIDKRFSYRGLTPVSDRMWNLSTALYYKAGGKPWRLATAREGVCYVGIAFRLENPEQSSRNGCCAAQMFLDDGDGVVFLGEYGPWYALDRRQFHLTPNAAKALLAGVLQTYQQLHGKPLSEVFLHARSGIDAEEFAGYRAAVPSSTKLVAIRVRSAGRGLRLFRSQTRPVLRGTLLRVSDRSGYLWASGFKPELATYDGSDVPVPLSIEVQQGDADIEQVASDILGLTKLNYNACKLGDSQPVTVAFSDAVGEILLSNPGVTHRRAQFRYYV